MPLRRARLRAALAGGLLGILVLALTGCDRPAAPGAVPAPTAQAGPAATHELGRKVYNFRCYFCHGYSGDARTLAATYLPVRPRDFTQTAPGALARTAMIDAVRDGRGGTAMKGFAGILAPAEIEAVVDFVRKEFMAERAVNTRYHTEANGWPDHDRHAAAFPFARGEIALDTPWESLDAQGRQGKRLFLSACVSCHDHGRVERPGTVWESRAVTYPRDGYCVSCHQETPGMAPRSPTHPGRQATHSFAAADGSVPVRLPQGADAAVTAAYRIHDQPPRLSRPTALEQRGEHLFQKNCAFCHAADGTAKGWIGSFLEPHPRDLTSAEAMKGMTRERLARSIEEGIAGTSMPAWASVLSRAEIEAVMAYISVAFHRVEGVRRE